MIERSTSANCDPPKTAGKRPDRRRREYKRPALEVSRLSNVTLQGGSGRFDNLAGDRQR